MGLLFAFQWAVLGVEPVIPGTTDFTETIIDPNAPFTSQDWLFFGLLALSILWFLFIAGAVHKFTVDISEGSQAGKKEDREIPGLRVVGPAENTVSCALGFNTMALCSACTGTPPICPQRLALGLIAALMLVMFFFNLVFANFSGLQQSKENGGFGAPSKESVLFVVDNFWYSVIVLIVHGLLWGAVSVISAHGGHRALWDLFLWFQVTMRLRLKKYDYLYGEGAAVRTGEKKKIPWETLWFKEKEMVDRRSWKNIFTPWRD
jgi:hypothetical protein